MTREAGDSSRRATRKGRDGAREGEAVEVPERNANARPRRGRDTRASIKEKEKGDPGLALMDARRGAAEVAIKGKITAAIGLTPHICQPAHTSGQTRASGGINRRNNW